jgi:hypothetical protein
MRKSDVIKNGNDVMVNVIEYVIGNDTRVTNNGTNKSENDTNNGTNGTDSGTSNDEVGTNNLVMVFLRCCWGGLIYCGELSTINICIYGIYVLTLQKNMNDMNTVSATPAQTSHRKLIDIPEDVFRALSVKAAAMGINLKKYIEQLLVEEANEMEDAELYRYLVSTRPEGQVMVSESEKDDFMRRHGIGQYR